MKNHYYKLLIKVINYSFIGLFCQLFLAGLCIANDVDAQKVKSIEEVAIEAKYFESSLAEIFKDIESQTDFVFTYDKKDTFLKERYTYDKGRTIVADLFRDISAKKRLIFQQINNNISVRKKLNVNEESPEPVINFIDVTGTVTSAGGGSLPGVNILVKGTRIGTVTDVDGNYSINVPDENDILIFSFIGYTTQEVAVNGRSEVNITMAEDAQSLEEVVVVGYGTMRKSDLTGSVASADIESFRETANVNIVQSLQGSVAGLNIGSTTRQGEEPSMSIRGVNSLGGTSSPLIVLDGVIYRGRIVDINPADIKSVNILKDASASAIYGSQAANGVIILTTKSGTATEKPIFSYSGSVGFQSPTQLWTPMNREQFLQKNRDVWWRKAYLAPDYTQPNPAFTDASALVRVGHMEGYNNGTDADWLEPTIRTGLLNNHNLSMQSSSNYTSYFISLGYTDSKGYVKNDNFERYSVRMNIDNDILDWFRLGMQSFVSVSDYEGKAANLVSILNMPPVTEPYNEDGSLNLYPADFLTPLHYQEAEEMNKHLTLYSNFYADLDVPFVEGLKYRLNFSPNYRHLRFNTYNPYSLSETGEAEKQSSENYDYSLDNRVNYRGNFGKHSVDATLAAGIEKREHDYTSAYSGQFAMQGLAWNRLQDGSIEQQKTTASAWQESSTFQMARLLYNFDDRYLVTGTARRDGFSGFGENNKFGIFPSLALAWRISEEEFFGDNRSWLDNGKLRVSYGESGNRTLDRYQTLAKMTSAYTYTFGGSSAMSQTTSTLANQDLKWETTTSLNLGLDFAVLKSRINGAIDYYFSTTNDMLYQLDLPVMGGISSTFTNLGEIKNRGLELTLQTINIQDQDFSWESTVSFSRNRNEIVTLLGKDDDENGIEDDLVSEGLFIGEPISAIYTYNVLGLYQLDDTEIPSNSGPGLYKYEDLNNDGIITSEDRKIIGYEDPSYRVSFKNTFSYKNFSLMVFINAIQGGNNHYYGAISGPTGYSVDDNVRGGNYGVEHFDHWWTPRNPDSQFKELFTYDPVQNNRYFQRNFVRLQDISLSYRLNPSLLERLNVQEFSMFISGKNLYTWTDWLGLDPELGYGFRASHPLLKSLTFGLNVSF